MKREDVLKLLKQVQYSDQEKIKRKIFDQAEIFKGMGDQKVFNMTAQQQ